MKISRARSRVAWFVGAVVVLLQLSPALAGVAAAEGGRVRWVNVEINYIKWLTPDSGFPAMAGFVGGDITGPFVGKVLNLTFGATFLEIEATYQAGAGDQFFVAHIKGKQDFLTNTAVLNGVVTDGRMKGAKVHAEYDVIAACGQAGAVINGECYLGTIRIFGFVPR